MIFSRSATCLMGSPHSYRSATACDDTPIRGCPVGRRGTPWASRILRIVVRPIPVRRRYLIPAPAAYKATTWSVACLITSGWLWAPSLLVGFYRPGRPFLLAYHPTSWPLPIVAPRAHTGILPSSRWAGWAVSDALCEGQQRAGPSWFSLRVAGHQEHWQRRDAPIAASARREPTDGNRRPGRGSCFDCCCQLSCRTVGTACRRQARSYLVLPDRLMIDNVDASFYGDLPQRPEGASIPRL